MSVSSFLTAHQHIIGHSMIMITVTAMQTLLSSLRLVLHCQMLTMLMTMMTIIIRVLG